MEYEISGEKFEGIKTPIYLLFGFVMLLFNIIFFNSIILMGLLLLYIFPLIGFHIYYFISVKSKVLEKIDLFQFNLSTGQYLFLQKTIYREFPGERYDFAFCSFEADGPACWFDDIVRMSFSEIDFKLIAKLLAKTEFPQDKLDVDNSYTKLLSSIPLKSSEYFSIYRTKQQKTTREKYIFQLKNDKKIIRAFSLSSWDARVFKSEMLSYYV